MKKLYCLGLVSLLLSSCAGTVVNDQPAEPGEESRASLPENQDPEIVDLSAAELANCYIVTHEGRYKFKADNQFNLGEGLPVPPVLHVASASLVWQSEPGLVSSVSLEPEEDGLYINFEVAKVPGNVLLAALDEEGDIIWSWHIWMPGEEVSSVKSATGYEVMNMNLGALASAAGDPASYGMLYQWGRKDPFPASATLTGNTSTVGAPLYDMAGNTVRISNSSWYSTTDNTIAFSISHPTVCLSNYAQYSSSRDWLADGDDSLWGEAKTCYDPSPAGWRVAPADAFKNLTSSGGYAWDIDDFNVYDANGDGIINLEDYNYGWYFLVDSATPLYFPAASRYDGSYAMLMGSMAGLWGNYWSCSSYPSISGGAQCCLSFQIKGQNGEDWVTVSPAGGSSKADAYSIRCVRDTGQSGNSGVKVVYPD